MNGVICIDKPAGLTSFDVVARLKRLTGERKAGHAGTLDPMATGVLPVFFGDATKAISLLPCQDKRYTAALRLGITTDTGDITGSILTQNTPEGITEERVKAAAEGFKGEIMQVPPMYSALRLNGRRLYEIAREGGTVERESRPITIYDIALLGRSNDGDYLIDVSCSKGTYIRTLCEDIGAALGCGAAMSSLRRTFAAGFDISRSTTLESVTPERVGELADSGSLSDILLDVESCFETLPQVFVTEKQAVRFNNGGALSAQRLGEVPQSGLCRVKSGSLFIGLGEIGADAEGLPQVSVKCHFNRQLLL